MLFSNIQKMNRACSEGIGMDILIISTNNAQQQTFWQTHLERLRGQLIKPQAILVTILEEWPAGNGLGTLYAFQRGAEKIQTLYGIDISRKLEEGAAVAIYHTAGQGKRLCPLTCSEHSNKSAVKLPGLIHPNNSLELLSILEAVIKQTAIYAPSRKGRVSVFFGDQLFIPSLSCLYTPSHHADILAKFCDTPSREAWQEKGLHHYGIISCDKKGCAKGIDKIDFHTLQFLAEKKAISIDRGLGISLGTFSLSAPLIHALTAEFTPELNSKTIKMESDPHFWMAATLDLDSYLLLMQKKGVAPSFAKKHYQRMQHFLAKFSKQHPEFPFFGAVDIGSGSYWWDYGTVASYFANNIQLTGASLESRAMRSFFLLDSPPEPLPENLNKVKIDKNSIIKNCQIQSGTIENSILIGVTAEHLEVKNSLVIHSTVQHLKANHCLLYDIIDKNLSLPEQTIRADTLLHNQQRIQLYSTTERDGKKDWNERILSNPFSYEEIAQFVKR